MTPIGLLLLIGCRLLAETQEGSDELRGGGSPNRRELENIQNLNQVKEEVNNFVLLVLESGSLLLQGFKDYSYVIVALILSILVCFIIYCFIICLSLYLSGLLLFAILDNLRVEFNILKNFFSSFYDL